MKILSYKENLKRDKYYRDLMLKYVINNKLIELTEIIFYLLEVEYESSDEITEIKEIIRITYDECKDLDKISTLESLRQIISTETGEDNLCVDSR